MEAFLARVLEVTSRLISQFDINATSKRNLAPLSLVSHVGAPARSFRPASRIFGVGGEASLHCESALAGAASRFFELSITAESAISWASNDYGAIISRMDIVRAVDPGARFQTLPFVHPGGEILLRVDSWPKVERVLRAICRDLTFVPAESSDGRSVADAADPRQSFSVG